MKDELNIDSLQPCDIVNSYNIYLDKQVDTVEIEEKFNNVVLYNKNKTDKNTLYPISIKYIKDKNRLDCSSYFIFENKQKYNNNNKTSSMNNKHNFYNINKKEENNENNLSKDSNIAFSIFNANNCDNNLNKVSFSKTNINVNQIGKILRGLKENELSDVKFNDNNLIELASILGFGVYNQFIYIYSIVGNTSIGPFSINELKTFVNMKYVDGSTKIRFLDVFKFEGKAPFEFISLKDICNNDRFYEKVKLNSWLLHLSSTLEDKQKNLIDQKLELEKLKKLEIKNKKTSIINTTKIPLNINDSLLNNNIDENKSVNKETNMVVNQDNLKQKPISKKKRKGKDLDIKTGFFSLAKNEASYNEYYEAK